MRIDRLPTYSWFWVKVGIRTVRRQQGLNFEGKEQQHVWDYVFDPNPENCYPTHTF